MSESPQPGAEGDDCADREHAWVREMLLTHRVRGEKMPSESGDVWVFPELRNNETGHAMTFLLQVADDTLFEVFDRAGNSLGYSTLTEFTGGSGGADDNPLKS